jgi:hypothetical protein
MISIATQGDTEEVGLKNNFEGPEVSPFFYWVPCAGVKYYTYDYQPALQRRMARWTEKTEDDDPDYVVQINGI